MNSLLGTKHATFQVEYLGTRLKGDAFEWYTRNVERHDRSIKIWSLESIFEGLQKCFLNTLMHRQVLNKFDTLKQGKWTIQELIHELTKYTRCMVQYPDDYSFKRWLLSALRPSLQKEVLHRGITTEFSSIQEILEKSKAIKDSSWYDIRSRIIQEEPVLQNSAYKPAPRISKLMPNHNHKFRGFMNRSNKSVAGYKPPLQPKACSFHPHVPNITGTDIPLKEGELRCYECGQNGHIKPQCPKLKGKQRVARMQFEEVVEEDNQTDVTLTGVPHCLWNLQN